MLSTQANQALPLFPLLNLLSFCCKEHNLKTSFHCLPFSPCTSLISPDCIFHQSAALPPLAAPAQTWKARTANTSTLANTAAAAGAQIFSFAMGITLTKTQTCASQCIGSPLLVSMIQQLDPDSGSQKIHFVLLKAVAAKVSGRKKSLYLKH